MDYSLYEAEDFAADESFQNWVYKSNMHHIRFWESWLLQHPHKQETVQQAIRMLHGLKSAEEKVPVAKIDASWQKLDALLDKQENAMPQRTSGKTYYLGTHWYKIAAAIAGILLVATISLLILQQKDTRHQTPYGKISKITLPDGSQVTLNGNSKLSYNKDWNTDDREVWLEGEAFFNVAKQTTNRETGRQVNRKFIVHTAGLDVEVLGTTFNVLKRKGKTQVVLNTGKVKLESALLEKDLIMQPGELVEVSGSDKKLVKRNVNPEQYSSWIHKKLIFNNTPFSEIATMLEETYGLEVEVNDPALLTQQVTGSIPNDNIEVLLDALSQSFDLEITKTKNRILLKNAR